MALCSSVKGGLIAALSVALLAQVASAPPTDAAGRKKRKPKRPKTYVSEEAKIQTGTTLYNTADQESSVTALEFITSCSMPVHTQGLDAYVFEIPKKYQSLRGELRTVAKSALPFDLDVYVYDADCNRIWDWATPSENEETHVADKRRYVLVVNYLPGPVDLHIEFQPCRYSLLKDPLCQHLVG